MVIELFEFSTWSWATMCHDQDDMNYVCFVNFSYKILFNLHCLRFNHSIYFGLCTFGMAMHFFSICAFHFFFWKKKYAIAFVSVHWICWCSGCFILFKCLHWIITGCSNIALCERASSFSSIFYVQSNQKLANNQQAKESKYGWKQHKKNGWGWDKKIQMQEVYVHIFST